MSNARLDPNSLSPPKVSPEGLRALELLNAEEPDIGALEAVISRDPTLASTLIRYANSPLYRGAKPVTNVPAAITRLGLKNIRAAVVMASLRAATDPNDAVSRAIWEHSVRVAQLAKTIAQVVVPEHADDLEFLGLVHDIGLLTLHSNLPAETAPLVERAAQQKISIEQLEREAFGCTHDQVGAAALAQFRLPEHFRNLLSQFHDHPPVRDAAQPAEQAYCVLALAHQLWIEHAGGQLSIHEVLGQDTASLANALHLDEPALNELRARCGNVLEADPIPASD